MTNDSYGIDSGAAAGSVIMIVLMSVLSSCRAPAPAPRPLTWAGGHGTAGSAFGVDGNDPACRKRCVGG